jgi:hypothetical protein
MPVSALGGLELERTGYLWLAAICSGDGGTKTNVAIDAVSIAVCRAACKCVVPHPLARR